MACRDCENRKLSKRQDPEGWRDMEMGPTLCGKCARFQKVSAPLPSSGICRWKSKEPLPNSIVDRAPFVVDGEDDGEGCPQFKPREGHR